MGRAPTGFGSPPAGVAPVTAGAEGLELVVQWAQGITARIPTAGILLAAIPGAAGFIGWLGWRAHRREDLRRAGEICQILLVPLGETARRHPVPEARTKLLDLRHKWSKLSTLTARLGGKVDRRGRVASKALRDWGRAALDPRWSGMPKASRMAREHLK